MYLFEIKPNSNCDGGCWFCVDKVNTCKNAPLKAFIKRLNLVIKELKKLQLLSDIFISGGEPTLYPRRLEAVLALLRTFDLQHVGLTTSGRNLSKCIRMLNIYPVNDLNISRHRPLTGGIKHAPKDNELREILDCLPSETNISLNCVLQKDTNFEEMERVTRKLGMEGITFLQATNINPRMAMPIERAFNYYKNKKYKMVLNRNAWHCHCRTFLSADGFWVRAKHASMPRILQYSNTVVNQFTLHPNGALTGDWRLTKKSCILPALCD